MSTPPILLIGRCSFWPEARDPEAWLRALVTMSNAAAQDNTSNWTSPRAVGETVLRGHLSRRGVPGLFGLNSLLRVGEKVAAGRMRCGSGEGQDERGAHTILHGVGLLEQVSHYASASHPTWQLSAFGQSLGATWQTANHRQALEQLAVLLLTRSAWLRLALLKFKMGTWQLCQWDKLKASNGQLRAGKTLFLGNDGDSAAWLSGIEQPVLGAWWPQLSHEPPVTVKVHAPRTAKPDDGLSLSPLKSPLYLLARRCLRPARRETGWV